MTAYDLAILYLKKGAQDEDAAIALLDNKAISDEIVGFHCQQACEKCLKAVLVANEIEFRKTHDLEELLQLIEDNNINTPPNKEELGELEPFAVALRYDLLDEPTSFDRPNAMAITQRVSSWAKKQISN